MERLEPDVEGILQATRRYGNHLGVEFGTVYTSSAVVPDGTTPPAVADDYSDYQASATPSCRAPHVWLGRSAGVSTLDLFGTGFTILTGKSGSDWKATASALAVRFGVPVGCYAIGDPGLDDESGRFLEAYDITSTGAVLVRPDGYVGWRCATSVDHPFVVLGDALAHILSRPIAPRGDN